jgi:hypothetical protein
VGTDTSVKNVLEVTSQIMTSRGMLPNSNGVIHWSLSSLTGNPNISNALINGPYKKQALVPSSPWLDAQAPEAPAVQTTAAGDSIVISWSHAQEEDVFRWVVYHKYGNQWSYSILNRSDRSFKIPVQLLANGKTPLPLNRIAVSAVDRTGNESNHEEKKLSFLVPAIVPRSGWNANAAKSFKAHVPQRITIHHEGTVFVAGKDAAAHIKNVQVWGMGKDRNWSDIPYHFLIAPDGTIYEGRDVYTTGETATEYDPTGHLLISCLGDLEKQEMPKAQLDALIKLIAYTSVKYNIPYQTLASHKDFAKTDCPGKNLYQYLQNGYIMEQVKALVQK